MKKIIATMVAVALVAICANAQVVKENLSNKEIFALLKQGQDTVFVSAGSPVEKDGLMVHPVKKYWMSEGKGYCSSVNIVTGVRRDRELRQELAEKEVDTRLVEYLYDDKARDTRYYQVEGQQGVSSEDSNAGKIVKSSANKYGWALGVFGGYEAFKNDVNSPVFGVSAMFTQPWFMIEVAGEGGWTKYSFNANKAGEKYFNYRTSAIAGLTVPYLFDKYDLNRLYLVGGVKYKWFDTDTKRVEGEDYLSSTGNNLSPVFGLRYERRFFGTGNSLYFQITAEQDRNVIQNKNDEMSWGVNAKVGLNFGLGRNKVDNTNSK